MTKENLLRFSQHPNVSAFLHAIRLGEGTSDEEGYRRIVGGQLFDDFSRHPFDGTSRPLVYLAKYDVYSSAAGAYQIIRPTWRNLLRLYDFPDFSPQWQDAAAVGLIDGRRALDEVLEGKIEEAIAYCRLEWASLPGSPYGQRTEKIDTVLAEYQTYGGQFA
jgi:muramidase (phage lysozyme)